MLSLLCLLRLSRRTMAQSFFQWIPEFLLVAGQDNPQPGAPNYARQFGRGCPSRCFGFLASKIGAVLCFAWPSRHRCSTGIGQNIENSFLGTHLCVCSPHHAFTIKEHRHDIQGGWQGGVHTIIHPTEFNLSRFYFSAVHQYNKQHVGIFFRFLYLNTQPWNTNPRRTKFIATSSQFPENVGFNFPYRSTHTSHTPSFIRKATVSRLIHEFFRKNEFCMYMCLNNLYNKAL